MHERITHACAEVFKERGWGALQNLPSTVAALVLGARPGMRVLDMCAAPGGKTCALADMMNNQGSVMAFDRTGDKSAMVGDMARQYGHSECVSAYKKDSTSLVKVSEAVKARFSSKVRAGRACELGASRGSGLSEALCASAHPAFTASQHCGEAWPMLESTMH